MSKETIIRALQRFAWGFLAGFIGAFALITPPNFQNLQDIKVWFSMALFACITGGIMGLQKAISGYLKYDK